MQGKPMVILLVEDNPDHAQLIMRSFENHRIVNKIYSVGDGEAALDYLFQRDAYSNPEKNPQPHLILLDLRIPKIDGLEVLKEIKNSEKLRRIPVVILTSSEADKDLAKAYDTHANSYLVKPVGFDKFRKMMDDLGFYWLAWNCYPWS